MKKERTDASGNESPRMNSWEKQVIVHWEMINRMANRRFQQATLAEEAALFVMDGLAQDDWRRLQAYTGRSTLATYIGALTLRLLEDFARSRFGRVKAPLWIRRLGGIWTMLFRLLCLERFSPDEAVALVADRQPGTAGAAEEAAYRILGEIPSCGRHQSESTEFCEETTLPPAEDTCSIQEQQVEQEERSQLFTLLGRIIFDGAHDDSNPRLVERLMGAGIRLAPQERLLLQLCYRDGVAVTEAGRMLGLNRHQVHGRLRRLLERLRQDFASAGMEEELRLLL